MSGLSGLAGGPTEEQIFWSQFPNLAARYNFNDTSTLTLSSGKIEGAADQVNSNDLSTTGAARPTSTSGTLGTTARFDGSANFMQSGTITEAAHPNVVFFVGKFNSTGASRYVFDGDDAGHRHIIGLNGSDKAVAGDSTLLTESGTTDVLTEAIYAVRFRTTTSEIYRNGNLIVSGSAGNHALNGITVGSNAFGTGQFFNGDLYELVVNDGDLTLAELTKIGAYFMDKYCLPWAPLQPASTKVRYDFSNLCKMTKAGGGTPAVGDKIEAVEDLSGNAINGSQSTSANQPTIILAAGDLPGADFDGVNDYISVASGTVANPQAFLMVLVPSGSNTSYVMDETGGGAKVPHYVAEINTFWSHRSFQSAKTSTTPVANGAVQIVYVLTGVGGGANFKFYINGGSAEDDSLGQSESIDTGYRLGVNKAFNDFGDFTLHEWIHTTGTPTPAELNRWGNFWAAKYGGSYTNVT